MTEAVWQVWGPLLTIALIFAIRFRRAGRERPFPLARWWLLPSFFVALMALLLVNQPPTLFGWLALVVGIALGALGGWRRGKLTVLRVGPGGEVFQRTSPLAILLLLGIVALRFAIRHLWGGAPQAAHPQLTATLSTDLMLGLAVGLVVTTRVEVMLRARALLAAIRQSG